MNAISFLLLGSGLAMCGWRFVSAFQSKRDDVAKNDIGKLVSSVFFLSAAYNGILGIGSLFLSQSPNGLFLIQLLAHLALAALAFMSVYALYYIFWPTVSPRLPLTTIGLIGGLGFLLLLTSPSQPLAAAITFCLLTVSLLTTLYIFIQLFRRTEARSIKILSIVFSVLTLTSVAHALIQLFLSISSSQQITSLPLSALEITLGLVGAGVLIWSISTPALRGAVAIFIGLLGSWFLFSIGSHAGSEIHITNSNEIWSLAIQIVGIWGIWWGFKLARQHGGFKTIMGKAINFFTFGLLLQILGHNTYFIYTFFNKETPYPGFPDICYVASIILYIIAVITLGSALGLSFKLKETRGKIPGILLFLGVFAFPFLLQSYVFDWQKPLTIMLDFEYPFIESIFLAFCLMVYLSIDKIRYGAVKNKILLIFIALAAQYAADTSFFYQAAAGKGFDGDYVDLIFLGAYFLMAVAIIQLATKPTGAKVIKEEPSLETHIYIPRTPSYPKPNYGMYGAIAIFSIFLGWWATLYFGLHWQFESIGMSPWADLYSLIIIWGVWFGFRAARCAGGFKNSLGKAISFLTLGFLLQSIAGIIYGFYVNWLSITIPYPSLADIGWLGTSLLYVAGSYHLCKAVGINQIIKTYRSKFLAILPGVITFAISSIFILSAGYTFNWQELIKTLLDISTPLIGAFYIALGILAYRATKGGNSIISQKQILWILIALVAQHTSDTNFIYQVTAGTWIDGSYGDLLLLAAYFAMTIAIIKIGNTTKANEAVTIAKGAKLESLPFAANLRERLLSISITQATNIDAKDIEVLRKETDWRKPQWVRVVNQLYKAKYANENIAFMYIFRKQKNDSTKMEFVADADSIDPYANISGNPSRYIDVNRDGKIEPNGPDKLQWPGQDYPEAVNIPEAFEAYEKPLTVKHPYTDAYGTVFTSYAPIKDETGNTVAVLATDIKANCLPVNKEPRLVIKSNAYFNILNLFETIQMNSKNQSLILPHNTTPSTFP